MFIQWLNRLDQMNDYIRNPYIPCKDSTYLQFETCPRRGVLDTTLYDKVCQWHTTGLWFSPGTPVSSTNKTDRYDITEILLKVVLNAIKQTNKPGFPFSLISQLRKV
jgi:hypothetical protein